MLRTWLASSLVRHYPQSVARPARALHLDAALNERFSFQVALRTGDQFNKAQLEVKAPAGWSVRVRRVGYVPMHHLNGRVDIDGLGHVPGLVPDPLFDDDRVACGPHETQAFYVTLNPGRRAAPAPAPGSYTIKAYVHPEKGPRQSHSLRVRLHDVRIAKRRDFPVTNWVHYDHIVKQHGCQGYDRKFWSLLPAYLKNMAEHGQDTVQVPMFVPKLQMLGIRRAGRGYEFDWSTVRRFLKVAQDCGLTRFEWPALFTPWNAAFAIPMVEAPGSSAPGSEKLLWRTRPNPRRPEYRKYLKQMGGDPKTIGPSPESTSPEYRGFLAEFLPAFRDFMAREGVLGRSYFHIADEPETENLHHYEESRDVLRELAPWMKIMDAMTHVDLAVRGVCDIPVPTIGKVKEMIAAGVPCWCYYCCGPREKFLQRLFDTPLAKIRMNGWLFYKLPVHGFLHWGYNWWGGKAERDPFAHGDGGYWPNFPYGDPFVVYPGPAGPIDSIRWEAFGDSLQDFALLQSAGLDAGHTLLRPIRDFENFPKSAAWIARARQRVLTGNI